MVLTGSGSIRMRILMLCYRIGVERTSELGPYGRQFDSLIWIGGNSTTRRPTEPSIEAEQKNHGREIN